MPYRVNHPHLRPTHHRQRAVNDATTPSRIYINNGTSTHVVVPCYYLNRPEMWHDHHWHDHVGWPSPNHPDHCCQKPFDRWGPFWKHWPWKTSKINFVKEKYEDGRIVWESEPENCVTAVRIANREKNEVEFDISVDDPNCVHSRGIYRFAVHVYCSEDHVNHYVQDGTDFKMVSDYFPAKNDIVYLGELVVLPAGLDGDYEFEPEDTSQQDEIDYEESVYVYRAADEEDR